MTGPPVEPERPAPPERTRAANRRPQILDVAEAHFARLGFRATKLRSIASEVRIRVANLYNHFAGKDDLYAAHPAIVHLFQNEMLLGRDAMHPLMRDWLVRPSQAGRSHLQRLYVGPGRFDETSIPLLQLAMFNIVCGDFKAAPLHQLLTGHDPRSPRALARQPQFLHRVEQTLLNVHPGPGPELDEGAE